MSQEAVRKVRIKPGFAGEGKEGTLLHVIYGPDFPDLIGQSWAVVCWPDEDEPSLFKVAGLQVETSTWSAL